MQDAAPLTGGVVGSGRSHREQGFIPGATAAAQSLRPKRSTPMDKTIDWLRWLGPGETRLPWLRAESAAPHTDCSKSDGHQSKEPAEPVSAASRSTYQRERGS
jgi:hypothetical protein